MEGGGGGGGGGGGFGGGEYYIILNTHLYIYFLILGIQFSTGISRVKSVIPSLSTKTFLHFHCCLFMISISNSLLVTANGYYIEKTLMILFMLV